MKISIVSDPIDSLASTVATTFIHRILYWEASPLSGIRLVGVNHKASAGPDPQSSEIISEFLRVPMTDLAIILLRVNRTRHGYLHPHIEIEISVYPLIIFLLAFSGSTVTNLSLNILANKNKPTRNPTPDANISTPSL